jgi:hypothetical protein
MVSTRIYVFQEATPCVLHAGTSNNIGDAGSISTGCLVSVYTEARYKLT